MEVALDLHAPVLQLILVVPTSQQHIFTYLLTYSLTYLFTYLLTNLITYLLACLLAYLRYHIPRLFGETRNTVHYKVKVNVLPYSIWALK